MSNPIILEKDFSLLKSLIGRHIGFAVAPDLVVSRQHYSCLTSIRSENPLTFYHSSPISLCVIHNNWRENIWVALDAGPDSSDEPWAPFAARIVSEPITTCLFGEIKHPNGWVLEEQEFDERPARLELWTGSIIKKIIVHRLGVYAALTCEHEDGLIWSAYAEYDRMFWLSFDKEVASAIEAEHDDYAVLQ
ncbi:hypothetical protein [Hymenobacter sp. BT730]|uniref:hypothetical protein n=1 Tax=Hymenobacter sp. BT730 TaxID=3063332 RepID=UPI0026DF04B3|nr:hypothetical protein [Hymenobacter sp. BT730]